MLKFLTLALMPLLASAAEPLPKFLIVCASSVSQSRVWNQDGKVFFRMEDNIGFMDFPIFSGVITPASVPLVKRAAEELKPFDGSTMMSWDESQCQYNPNTPLLVMCSGHGQLLVPAGAAFTPTGVNTAIEDQTRLDMNYSRVNFNVGLDTPQADYTHYFLGFPYDKTGCNSKTGP